jgi:hypothetical protein
MRDKLIEEIKKISIDLFNDDLDWYPWNTKSNMELLDQYGELRVIEFQINGPPKEIVEFNQSGASYV